MRSTNPKYETICVFTFYKNTHTILITSIVGKHTAGIAKLKATKHSDLDTLTSEKELPT